ncbi:sigma-54-dependent Fis family transcriptional regulator [Siminovitchia acidinfaciens]|uniref:sigma-54-dependent Fis family transcriptional regulator n=1 Tax=Siminovitchia acidinfaciens TaxID=2321395 RepID=UPI001F40A7DF|nr:sigma-54-dependent Fis family transcriptional regulator [Siminovitchia acidinfaciens]
MNTYLAVHSADNLHIKMRELESEWDYFVSERQKPNRIRQMIYQSWKRCEKYDVDPLQKQTSVIIDDQSLCETITNSKIYDAALPIIHTLHEQIKGTGHLITLADDKGRIIHLEGETKIIAQAEEMSFIRGSDWSEKAAGSNAIGTSLAVGHPIQIFSYEHYCEGVHPWNCSAAPIKDPLSGKILGIIDLTGPSQLAQPHSLSIVQNISKMIQQNFKIHSFRHREHLQKHYEGFTKRWHSDSVILLDEMLNIVHADAKCRSLLQIDHWRQLAAHSEFQHIRNSLLTSNESEWELDVPSLQIKVYVQIIVHGLERIGYLLHLEKTNQIRNFTYWGRIIGNSQPMNQLIARAKIAAPTSVPILLTGESGTGKEVFARAIHKESFRNQSPFIAINCGAIPKELMASELFGYEAGAFTGGNPKGKAGKFEEAHGGTLLLDEIGEMPLDLQVHLLRVLQEKEIVRLGSAHPKPIDVRIIAATNRNLKELIENGKFREDLYYRLNVVEFKIPSLRERKEDIPLLTRYYIIHFSKKHGRPVPTIGNEVLSHLNDYNWPGNIRELTNTIEYAVLFSSNNHITLDSLPDTIQNFRPINQQLIDENPSLTLLEVQEKEKIKQLIEETSGNLSEVARRCQIARTTLYRKLEKYQL